MSDNLRSPFILKETSRGTDSWRIEDEMFSRRKIFLTTEVNADSSNELLKQLMYLSQEKPNEEITLYINSPGGEVVSGLAVYDCIRMIQAPVKTVCTGTAASMSAILFLAGETREMLPHTKIMIHDPSFGKVETQGEKPLEMQKRLEDILKVRKILGEIIAERTGQSLRKVYGKTKGDAYFTAEEAIKFGIATKITERL
jgi:ATP-dependent Clp protease protease subunit